MTRGGIIELPLGTHVHIQGKIVVRLLAGHAIKFLAILLGKENIVQIQLREIPLDPPLKNHGGHPQTFGPHFGLHQIPGK